jgi:hypothetical protein
MKRGFNFLGLDEISVSGQEFILQVEADASAWLVF